MSVRYKELYEVELAELMKKEFSGNFGLTLKFLALPFDKGKLSVDRYMCTVSLVSVSGLSFLILPLAFITRHAL
jgi:hypothetical protein